MKTARNTTVDRPLACLAGLLLLLSIGCNRAAETPEYTGITASGYIEATEVRLSSKIGGTLQWFLITEGDRLDEGAEVARIDTTDLQLQLDAARAEQAMAEAELRLKSSGFRPEEINEARAGVERARTELAATERDLERFAGLLESGSGTEKARDDARARRDVARSVLDAAGQRLAKLEAGFRKEEIAAARARSNAAAARIALLEQQTSDATVTSPVSGTVTEKLVEQGELLPPGALLAVISDLENVWLTAYVSEPDLDRLQLGQAVQLTTDSGESRSGTLSWISPQAEFTPKNVQTRDERIKLVFKIKVLVEDNNGLFKPGMPGTAMLETS